MLRAETIADAMARRLLSSEQRERLARLPFRDAGHGFDVFGASPRWAAAALGILRPLYERYFRVRSFGAHHVPASGAAILAANHSGTLPLDALMLAVDVALSCEPPRLARPIGDVFIPKLPFVSTLVHRMGQVAGSRGNTRRLLEMGELLMVFPEGVSGIGKLLWQRYQLQRWHVGHAELAIRHRAPVVPVAIIGAEEQLPQLARLPSFGLFGLPYLPIVATPLPLPVRYSIYYGEPIAFDDTPAAAADEPRVVQRAARRVNKAVRALIERGLAARRGIFR